MYRFLNSVDDEALARSFLPLGLENIQELWQRIQSMEVSERERGIKAKDSFSKTSPKETAPRNNLMKPGARKVQFPQNSAKDNRPKFTPAVHAGEGYEEDYEDKYYQHDGDDYAQDSSYQQTDYDEYFRSEE